MRTRTRTRKFLAGATSLMLGWGVASEASAQLQLRGSDTLEDVTRDAVAATGVNIVYVGGGTTTGQAAMVSTPPLQQIAPMSRELNGTACTTLGATIGQELIALDGMAIVGANQTGGDSTAETAGTGDDCSDSIRGGLVLNVPGCGANDGCDASSNYTFTDWKDVLAMVYGGQNHNTTTPQLQGTTRNPARINCNSAVRRALVNNWGNLFADAGAGGVCRTGTCTKLKHAFRRDDVSGTTDTFVSLVGLLGIPNYTTAFDPSPVFLPRPDAAARPNPFCNAGDAPMNKGDADFLDLDPIRRAVDHNATDTTNRPILEAVGQASLPAFGGNNNDANCEPADGDSTVAGVQPKLPPTDSSSSTQPGVLPSQVIPDAVARLREELGFNPVSLGGAAITKPTTRQCLGLVLPIAMPANYTSEDAYFGANAAGTVPPVPCSINPTTNSVEMRFVIPDTQHSATALCPDGKNQPCRLPVSLATGTNNFNCYVGRLNPTILPLRDNRGFNLHPLQTNGQYRRDNYVNPNIPVTSIPAARQNRVVTAFYRLHFNGGTNVGGSNPTLPAGTGCRTLSATNQIGCLVKASTCSIGFAGREAVDPLAVGDNFAFRIQDIQPSTVNIQNLVTGGSPVYPIARRLWVNSVIGFANVTGDELTLLNFMRNPALLDPIIQARNFTVVPPGVVRSRPCPAGP